MIASTTDEAVAEGRRVHGGARPCSRVTPTAFEVVAMVESMVNKAVTEAASTAREKDSVARAS